MELKNTSTKTRQVAAFTLPEVMIASGLGVLALMAVGLLSLYSSRSFVAMTNYVGMDQSSQLALDKMSREIRQSHGVTAITPTILSFQDVDNNPVQFVYDSGARKLVRVSGGVTNIYLPDCDSLQFSMYQHTVQSNSFECYDYDRDHIKDARVLKLTWVCSRTILGAKANTESVQSAKIALRNH